LLDIYGLFRAALECDDVKEFYNLSNNFARERLVKTRHVTEYSPAKTGEYPSDIPQFSKPRVLRKIFEGY